MRVVIEGFCREFKFDKKCQLASRSSHENTNEEGKKKGGIIHEI